MQRTGKVSKQIQLLPKIEYEILFLAYSMLRSLRTPTETAQDVNATQHLPIAAAACVARAVHP